MTRETKIGLLVGLAFIIVIGILLSHQLEQSTEPPAAQIALVGPNVRNGVTVLGGSRPQNALVTAPSVTPDQTVPTADDLTRKPATAIVKVTGPARDAAPPVLAQRGNAGGGDVAGDETPAQQPRSGMMLREDAAQQQASTGGEAAEGGSRPASANIRSPQRTGARSAQQPPVQDDAQPSQNIASDDPRVRAARQQGEEVLFLGGHSQNGSQPAAQTQRTFTKTYKAQAGDSLSRMAAKFFGQDSPAAEQAIIRANPSLEANRDLIIAGRNYNIPALVKTTPASAGQPTDSTASSSDAADASNAPADGSDQGGDDAAPIAAHPSARPAPASAEHFYVVKKGDTLWGIATTQLGSGSAVAAIEELNRDVLKNGTTVREGMKLRLPAKSIASVE